MVVVTDEDKSYRQIEASFVGSGKVEWTEGSGEDSDTHKAKEEYLNESVTLWDDGQEEVLPADATSSPSRSPSPSPARLPTRLREARPVWMRGFATSSPEESPQEVH